MVYLTVSLTSEYTLGLLRPPAYSLCDKSVPLFYLRIFRFRSAFFCFSSVKRSEVSQAHPEWKIGQVAQELGRQWKDLTDDMKKRYEDMAQQDKGRYEIVS